MMLNLQFAETMELTEVELEAVYGGMLRTSQVVEIGEAREV